MEIKELQKKDFQKVIEYAISGMHFEEYLTNKLMLNIYGRYFWYLEYINATQVIAAYEDKKLLGVLVADIQAFSNRLVCQIDRYHPKPVF